MTYNGYTNYQTWCVNLWLMNEPAEYEFVMEAVGECEGSRYQLADALEEHIKDMAYDIMPEPSMMTDLLGYCIEEVDFHELAELYQREGEEADDDT